MAPKIDTLTIFHGSPIMAASVIRTEAPLIESIVPTRWVQALSRSPWYMAVFRDDGRRAVGAEDAVRMWLECVERILMTPIQHPVRA